MGKTQKAPLDIQVFFIALKGNDELSKLPETSKKITDYAKKSEICNKYNLNCSQVNLENYDFVDETESFKKNDFLQGYARAIFDVYFPTKWDAKDQKYYYYPKEATVGTDALKLYIYKWTDVAMESNTKSIRIIMESTHDGRGVLIVNSNNI